MKSGRFEVSTIGSFQAEETEPCEFGIPIPLTHGLRRRDSITCVSLLMTVDILSAITEVTDLRFGKQVRSSQP